MSTNAATIAAPTFARELTLPTPAAELIGPHPVNTRENLVDVAERLGSFFFSPDTMRFFSSRVMKDIFPTGRECGYFVTSERDTSGAAWGGARRYTIRRYNVTRDADGGPRFGVDVIGDHGEYATRRGALGAARHYRERERAGRDIITANRYRYTFAA